MLYGTITEFCTPAKCPMMTAGPKYIFLYLFYSNHFYVYNNNFSNYLINNNINNIINNNNNKLKFLIYLFIYLLTNKN